VGTSSSFRAGISIHYTVVATQHGIHLPSPAKVFAMRVNALGRFMGDCWLATLATWPPTKVQPTEMSERAWLYLPLIAASTTSELRAVDAPFSGDGWNDVT
jgi:hypothetical protein